MRRVLIGWVFYLLTALAVAPCSSALEQAWNDRAAADVRTAIRNYMTVSDARHVTRPETLSVAIGRNGRMLFADGFGTARAGSLADADTLYRIGSLSKQMTAATVLHLLEAGARTLRGNHVVGLDAPVSDILEGVASWDVPGQKPITLRSLLTMTSNLPNFTRKPPKALDPWGTVLAADLLAELKKTKPSGWPSSFEYSNTNYFLLAAVIENMRLPDRDLTGGYRTALRRVAFDRAGLVGAHFIGETPNEGAIVAEPHFRRRPAFNSSDWLKGSGDVVASARDIFKWNTALMTGRIVSPMSLAFMFDEHARVTPTLYYGMGWFVTEHEGWQYRYHTGTVPGYTSINVIALDPATLDWISITILSSSDGVTELEVLAEELFRYARAP